VESSSPVDNASVSAGILGREFYNRSVNCFLSIISSLSFFIGSWPRELQFIVVVSRL
jgi:hypothetical protein